MDNSLNYILELIKKCKYIELDSAFGEYLEIPKYDITPSDFLKFAEEELDNPTTKSKINTISNLKRALDCQIDMFLECLCLKKIFDKNNLKFEQKTKFLTDIGVLSAKSVNRLNFIRNKLEHQYVYPAIEDLQVYHDLIWSVIEIIQAKLLTISSLTEIFYSLHFDDKEYYCGIIYDFKKCIFRIEIHERQKRNKEIITAENSTKNKFILSKNKEMTVTNIEVHLNNKNDEASFISAFNLYLSTTRLYIDDDTNRYMDAINEIQLL